jgi:hypothetical protein
MKEKETVRPWDRVGLSLLDDELAEVAHSGRRKRKCDFVDVCLLAFTGVKKATLHCIYSIYLPIFSLAQWCNGCNGPTWECGVMFTQRTHVLERRVQDRPLRKTLVSIISRGVSRD